MIFCEVINDVCCVGFNVICDLFYIFCGYVEVSRIFVVFVFFNDLMLFVVWKGRCCFWDWLVINLGLSCLFRVMIFKFFEILVMLCLFKKCKLG